MKIGLMVKRDSKEAEALACRLVQWASQRGHSMVLEKTLAQALNMTGGHSEEDIPACCDLVVVLGGDGTLLHTARLVGGLGIPILGVNIGGLGFLTEVSPEELFQVLPLVESGQYRRTRRMMLSCSIIRDSGEIMSDLVLNDVVVNNGVLARIIELDATVDGTYVTNFRADGLILATPTGSTAYSLAAGGPIVVPTQEAILMTPICPQFLTNRPIVLADNAVVEVVVRSRHGDAQLSLDGQKSLPLKYLDRIVVKKATEQVVLVSSPTKDYFEILRTKLGWGGGYGAGRRFSADAPENISKGRSTRDSLNPGDSQCS